MKMPQDVCNKIPVYDYNCAKDYRQIDDLNAKVTMFGDKALQLNKTVWVPYSQMALDDAGNLYIRAWLVKKNFLERFVL